MLLSCVILQLSVCAYSSTHLKLDFQYGMFTKIQYNTRHNTLHDRSTEMSTIPAKLYVTFIVGFKPRKKKKIDKSVF